MPREGIRDAREVIDAEGLAANARIDPGSAQGIRCCVGGAGQRGERGAQRFAALGEGRVNAAEDRLAAGPAHRRLAT